MRGRASRRGTEAGLDEARFEARQQPARPGAVGAAQEREVDGPEGLGGRKLTRLGGAKDEVLPGIAGGRSLHRGSVGERGQVRSLGAVQDGRLGRQLILANLDPVPVGREARQPGTGH
jgi:hypothetical protein